MQFQAQLIYSVRKLECWFQKVELLPVNWKNNIKCSEVDLSFHGRLFILYIYIIVFIQLFVCWKTLSGLISVDIISLIIK